MNKYVIGVMSLASVVALTLAVPTFAQGNPQAGAKNAQAGIVHQSSEVSNPGFGRGPNGVMKPFIVGTVSVVRGNTITVLGRTGLGKTVIATTSYTVDVTNAKVTKGNATSTISNIAVGDMVAVQGTITGTNVVATMIRDGVAGGPGMGFGRGGPGGPGKTATSTNSIIAGNGEPVIAGTISTISGSTISITNKSNVVYTVDATNAKILQGKNTVTVSTLKIGDTVVVQGMVNGTSIVATSVMDQTKPANSGNGNNNPHPGFFTGIGQFFMHIFGF